MTIKNVHQDALHRMNQESENISLISIGVRKVTNVHHHTNKIRIKNMVRVLVGDKEKSIGCEEIIAELRFKYL